jgi:hypothetical protein
VGDKAFPHAPALRGRRTLPSDARAALGEPREVCVTVCRAASGA